MESLPFLDGRTIPSGESWTSKARFVFPALCIVAILATVTLVFRAGIAYGASSETTENISDYLPGPMNATLGFGEIILLNLPERTDRRDAMTLICSAFGILITKTINAIKGETVSDKAKPLNNDLIDVAHLGSWRTHLDAFRHVVDNRIETALIFEDDVDWDVRIKRQMAAFARGMQTSSIRNGSSDDISLYPYGMDWDILHLGASRIRGPKPPYDRVYSIYEDEDRSKEPGCPNKFWQWFCWTDMMERLNVPANSRAILPSYDSVGLPAIAVTYHGAQRLLLQLSWVGATDTLDFSIRDLLKNGTLQGWDVLPPIFSMWKLGTAADSDLEENGRTNLGLGNTKPASQTEGSSPGIERSVRKELAVLLDDRLEEDNRWTKKYWESFGVGFEP